MKIKLFVMLSVGALLLPCGVFAQDDPFSEKPKKSTVLKAEQANSPFGSADPSGQQNEDPFRASAGGDQNPFGSGGGSPDDGGVYLNSQEKHRSLLIAYQSLEVQRAELRQQLGPAHPQVKALEAQMGFWADYIRNQKAADPFSESGYTVIAKLTQRLTNEVEKLRPLRENEKPLDVALGELKKALTVLKAEKTIRALSESDIQRTRKEMEAAMRRGKNAAGAADQAAVDAAVKASVVEKYRRIIQDRDAKLAEMDNHIVQAAKHAEQTRKNAMEAMLQARASLKEAENKAAQEKERAALAKRLIEERQEYDARLKNMEAQLLEMRKMLEESLKDK